jgi:ATP-dependent DNA helicase RecG
MTVKEFRTVMTHALEAVLPAVDDELPEYLLKVRKMRNKRASLQNIHFPESETSLQEAKTRLAYEEFLAIQLAVTMRRRQVES